MYTYICLKCTQFLKINAGYSLSAYLSRLFKSTANSRSRAAYTWLSHAVRTLNHG